MAYNREESPLHQKSYAFAVRIVKMVKALGGDWRLSSVFNQILRSGTSFGANVREAEFAQNSSDFIAKLSIALKEANESIYWLDLLKDADCLTVSQHKSMCQDCDELIAIIVASIKTAKTNQQVIIK